MSCDLIQKPQDTRKAHRPTEIKSEHIFFSGIATADCQGQAEQWKVTIDLH